MGFFKKLGKALGKGLGKIEKATRPVHGIARSVASGAANAVAPGSGQLVAAFTGGHRGAKTAGGVGGMLPQLGQITGINVASGRPFQFGNFGGGKPDGARVEKESAEYFAAHPQVERWLNTAADMLPGVRAGRGVIESAKRAAAGGRSMTMGYQGDSPPLMSSHRSGNVLQLPGASQAPRKKYKRMNVANTRALGRSIRRVKGFEKLARRVVNMNVGKRFKKRGRKR